MSSPYEFWIEVKGHANRWIGFRVGSQRGPQTRFPTQDAAENWLRRQDLNGASYRIVARIRRGGAPDPTRGNV